MKIIYRFVLFICISCCSPPNFSAPPTAPTETSPPATNMRENKTTIDFTPFVALLKSPTPEAWAKLLQGNPFELHRLFSSGNLTGSRGKETHQHSGQKDISKESEVLVPKQTPYSLTYSFNFLKATGIDKASRKTYDLGFLSNKSSSVLVAGFTQAIDKAFEDAETGGAVIFINADETQWMVADGQIIDDVVQGDFAVFSVKNGNIILQAIYSLR